MYLNKFNEKYIIFFCYLILQHIGCPHHVLLQHIGCPHHELLQHIGCPHHELLQHIGYCNTSYCNTLVTATRATATRRCRPIVVIESHTYALYLY